MPSYESESIVLNKKVEIWEFPEIKSFTGRHEFIED
jgi:hypothetical protein